MDVSAPHTAQRGAFLFRRSSETERLACSRISAGTTCSDFGCAFRLISPGYDYTMTETAAPIQLLTAGGTDRARPIPVFAPLRRRPATSRIARTSDRAPFAPACL